ncbi:hypothetical protein QFC24_005477 [Naganishia onofrii]|uniref:Uncharacterized protein n=1 Tax=Naganishia onofrii TaxID=1851511 RepID=A0ACC2X7H1_9TREE|nr:hypothetical protein QFC24_005477 [Naganishia onofrii]
MFTHDLVDTSIPGEAANRSPRSARLSSEGVKLDGLLYHSSVQLVKEIMNRSPSKRDRTLDRARTEDRQGRSVKEEDATLDSTIDTDALERARRRIADWPKRYRTSQHTVDDTGMETKQHSRTRNTQDPTSFIIVDETTENRPSEDEDDNEAEQPRNVSRNTREKTPSPSIEYPSSIPANDVSSSSSSAFRRRFEKIQNESPGRLSWMKDRSGEEALSVNGRNGTGVNANEDVEGSEDRLSVARAQEDAGRSRMHTVSRETSHNMYDRMDNGKESPAAPNATMTDDDEGMRSRITFARRSNDEDSSNPISRRETTFPRRQSQTSYELSRALPSLQETPRTNGSVLETSRARSGIDMSFSHVEHSTPIRSTGTRGLAVVGGVRAMLGPSSEEDDTVDSTVSSSPPARSTPMKVPTEERQDVEAVRRDTSRGWTDSPNFDGAKERPTTDTRTFSVSGEGSRAELEAAKEWSTPKPKESYRRNSVGRADTPTSVPRQRVFKTPTSQSEQHFESPIGTDDRLHDDAAPDGLEFPMTSGWAHMVQEQAAVVSSTMEQIHTTPAPTATTDTALRTTVTTSPQAQRLARAVTQQVMTWYEQEVLRTQEQEAATRAREEAESVLRKRLRIRGEKAAQESRRAWWRWCSLGVLYISFLGLFAMVASSPASRTVISPSDEFYFADFHTATTTQPQFWGFIPQVQRENVCRWASRLAFPDLDEQNMTARCGGSGKSRLPRRKKFRVPV